MKSIFKNHKLLKMRLGDRYVFGRDNRIVRLIKVTPKGFNLLDEATGRCILHRHVHAPKYRGRDVKVPRDRTNFKLAFPTWVELALKYKLEPIEQRRA